LREQTWGVEIEMTGITRAAAAQTVAGYFGTQATHIGGTYDTYAVRDDTNRQWKLLRDVSVAPETHGRRTAGDEYKVELVTPICRYEDIETLQEIVRALRATGARVNSSCGMHCHIGADQHSAQTLRNIVNIMAAKEDLLYKTLRVQVNRERYCKRINTDFLDRLNRNRPQYMEDFEQQWYDGTSRRHVHYHDSRYRGLNLHSVFDKGTVEFRMFNATLHAGEVKTAIQLCLAISHQALTQSRASHSKTESSNEKYTFRTWLLRLGLIGDEFKTARQHLLKNLEGSIAWKDPAQAEAQRLRLAEQRAKEQAVAPVQQSHDPMVMHM
jgi:hypothetical protein